VQRVGEKRGFGAQEKRKIDKSEKFLAKGGKRTGGLSVQRGGIKAGEGHGIKTAPTGGGVKRVASPGDGKKSKKTEGGEKGETSGKGRIGAK